MVDRDSYFLYEMYQQVLFNEASLKPITIPREELIGKIVDIHPVVSPNPDEDDYMQLVSTLRSHIFLNSIPYLITLKKNSCLSITL